MTMASNRTLKVKNADESKTILKNVLSGVPGAALDIVVLNTAAALYCANVVKDIPEGLIKARQAIASGAAMKKLSAMIQFTQSVTKSA